MKINLNQLNKDCDILHDFVAKFYEANFSDNGREVLIGSANAIVELHKMNEYVKDLISSYVEIKNQNR